MLCTPAWGFPPCVDDPTCWPCLRRSGWLTYAILPDMKHYAPYVWLAGASAYDFPHVTNESFTYTDQLPRILCRVIYRNGSSMLEIIDATRQNCLSFLTDINKNLRIFVYTTVYRLHFSRVMFCPSCSLHFNINRSPSTVDLVPDDASLIMCNRSWDCNPPPSEINHEQERSVFSTHRHEPDVCPTFWYINDSNKFDFIPSNAANVGLPAPFLVVLSPPGPGVAVSGQVLCVAASYAELQATEPP